MSQVYQREVTAKSPIIAELPVENETLLDADEIAVWVPVKTYRTTACVVQVRRGTPSPIDMEEVEWDDEADKSFVNQEINAIRVRFLPAQQAKFLPVEWDEVDEEIFDV